MVKRRAIWAVLMPVFLILGVSVVVWIRQSAKSNEVASVSLIEDPAEDDGRDPVASGLRNKPIYPIAVRSVAFSPNGKWLAVGAGDGGVRLWDLHQHKFVHTIDAHDNWVFDLTFHPLGTLISGGGDNTVVLIEPETGAILRRFQDHSNDLHGVAVTPDGEWLVTGSDDETVVARSLRDDIVRILGKHAKQVTSITISRDGSAAASSSRDGTVRLWDLKTFQLLRELTGHTADVMSVAFSPDGSMIATGSYDKTVRLWTTETGTEKHAWDEHATWVFSVLFLPDGKHLLSGCGDGHLRMFRISDGERVDDHPFEADVADLALTPDGAIVVAGLSNGFVHLLSVESAGLKRLPDPIAIEPIKSAQRGQTTTDAISYLQLHTIIRTHGTGWSDTVGRMSQYGDAFTLYLLKEIDRTNLASDEAELLGRVIEQIETRRGDHPDKINVNEVGPMLVRATVADLNCSSLEHVIRNWVLNDLTSQSADPTIRHELESVRSKPPVPSKDDQQNWGLVSERMGSYINLILRSSERTDQSQND